MELEKTNNGWPIYHFKDRYQASCSIQKSSLAFEDAIWMGVDDINPVLMISDAEKLGLPIIHYDGYFSKFEIPKEVIVTNRMHLTQKQVAKLLPILQKFVETGNL